MSQLELKPESIIQAQQETISKQQNELVMLRAAIIQLSAQTNYREGDDPTDPVDGTA